MRDISSHVQKLEDLQLSACRLPPSADSTADALVELVVSLPRLKRLEIYEMLKTSTGKTPWLHSFVSLHKLEVNVASLILL